MKRRVQLLYFEFYFTQVFKISFFKKIQQNNLRSRIFKIILKKKNGKKIKRKN